MVDREFPHLEKAADPIRAALTPWRERSLAAVLLLLGLVLRLPGLSAHGLNSDEVYTVLQARDGVFAQLMQDIHPPLYPLLIKPVLWLGPEIGPRLASVLAGLVFCFAIWRITRRGFGKEAALVALLLAVTSPPLVWLSRLARSYSLVAALIGLLVWLWFLRIERPDNNRLRLLLILCGAASLYTFYYSVFPLVYLAMHALLLRRSDKRLGSALLVDLVAIILLFAPMVLLVATQAGRVAELRPWTVWETGVYQLVRRTLLVLMENSTGAGFMMLTRFLLPLAPAKILLLLAGVALVAFGWIGGVRRNLGLPTMGFLVGLLFFTLTAAIVAHWTLRLLIAEHYFVFLAVAVVPLTAAALLLARRNTAYVLIAILVMVNIVAAVPYRARSVEELRKQVEWIEENASDNAAVVTVAFFIADAYRLYGKKNLPVFGLPEDLPGHEPLPREADGFIPIDAKPQLAKLLAGRNEVFLMASHTNRGGRDRGLDLVTDWLTDLGYKPLQAISDQGVTTTYFRK